MRFIGLTIALLASSLGARAQSAEDRVAALEARVKSLEANNAKRKNEKQRWGPREESKK